MKKSILILFCLLLLVLPGCSKNKSKCTTNEKPYSLVSRSYFMDDNPEYMGKAMHFAYQEYSGISCPVIMYPDYGYVKKSNNVISFINISSKQILEVQISLKGHGDAEDQDVMIHFDNFDFLPGRNVSIKLFDSLLNDNEYTIAQAIFYFFDLSDIIRSKQRMCALVILIHGGVCRLCFFISCLILI